MLSLLPGRDLPGTSGARVAEARRVVRAYASQREALHHKNAPITYSLAVAVVSEISIPRGGLSACHRAPFGVTLGRALCGWSRVGAALLPVR